MSRERANWVGRTGGVLLGLTLIGGFLDWHTNFRSSKTQPTPTPIPIYDCDPLRGQLLSAFQKADRYSRNAQNALARGDEEAFTRFNDEALKQVTIFEETHRELREKNCHRPGLTPTPRN